MLNNRMKGAYYHTYQVKLASKANVMALIDELKSYYEVLMKLLNETNDRIDHDREVMKEKLNAIYNKLLHMQFILTKFNDEIDLAIAEKLQNLMEHFETGIVDMIQQYDCNLFNHNLFTGVEEGEELKLEDSEIYDRSIFHIGTELGFRWFGGKISSKRVLTELDNCFRLTKATNLGMKKTEDYINSNPIIELFIYGPRGMSWLEIGQNATFGYNVVIKYNSLKDNLKATLRSEDYTVPREFDTNVLDINIIFDMLYDANDNLKEDTYIKVKTNLPAASFGGIPQYFLSDAKSTSDYADAKAVKNSDVRVLNENNRDVSYAKDFNDSVEDFYKKQPEVIITSQTFRHKDNKSTDKELLENMTSMDGVIEAKLDAADTVKISSIVKRTDQNDEFGGVDALHSGITLGELGKDAYQDEEYFTDKQDLINESMEPNSSPLYNSGDQNIDLFDYRDLGTVSLITKNENMFGVDNAMHNSPVVVNNNEDYGDFKNDKGLRNKIINDSLLDVLSDNEFYEDKPAKVSEMGHVILENENGETSIGDNIKITGVYETSAGTFASSNAGVYKWDDNYSKFVKTNITKGNWGKIFSTPDGNVWFLSLDNDGIYKLDRTVTDSNANPQLVRTNVVTGTFTDAIVTKTGDFFALCSESNHNFDPITSKYKINALVWVYTDGNLCEYSDYLVKKYNDDSLDCVINEEIATKLTGGSYKVWHLPLIDTFYILNLKSKTLFKSAVGIFGDFSIAIPNEVSNYQDGYVTIDGKIQKMTADGNFSKVYTKTTTEINGLKNVVSNHVVTDMNLEDLNYCNDETDSVEIPDGTIKVLDDEMFAIPENLSYSVKEYEEIIKKTYQMIYDIIQTDGTKKIGVAAEYDSPFHYEPPVEDGDAYSYKSDEFSYWRARMLNFGASSQSGILEGAIVFKNNKHVQLIQYPYSIMDITKNSGRSGKINIDLTPQYIFGKINANGSEKNRHVIYSSEYQQISDISYLSRWVYDENAINYKELSADLAKKIYEKINELKASSNKSMKYHKIIPEVNWEYQAPTYNFSNYVIISGFDNFKIEKIEKFDCGENHQDSTFYILTVSDDVLCVDPVLSNSGLSYEINIKNVKFHYSFDCGEQIDVDDIESFYNNFVKEFDDIESAKGTNETFNANSEDIIKFIVYRPWFVYDLDNPSCNLYDETFDYGNSLEEFKEIINEYCYDISEYKYFDYLEYEYRYSKFAISKPEIVRIEKNKINNVYSVIYKAKWIDNEHTLDEVKNIEPYEWSIRLNDFNNPIDSDGDGEIDSAELYPYLFEESTWKTRKKIENYHPGYSVKNNKTPYALAMYTKLNDFEELNTTILNLDNSLPVMFPEFGRVAGPRKITLCRHGFASSMKHGPYEIADYGRIEDIKPVLLTHFKSDDDSDVEKHHIIESGPLTFCKSVADMLDEHTYYESNMFSPNSDILEDGTAPYKYMNYYEFFKQHNIGITSEDIEILENKWKDFIKTLVGNDPSEAGPTNKYLGNAVIYNKIEKVPGSSGEIICKCPLFQTFDINKLKINKRYHDDDRINIDGKHYNKCNVEFAGLTLPVCHVNLDSNGKFTFDFSLEEDKSLNFVFYVEWSEDSDLRDIIDYSSISEFMNYLNEHYEKTSIKGDNYDPEVINEYDIDEVVEYYLNNFGFYISSNITDLDELCEGKNNNFAAYDKTPETFAGEILKYTYLIHEDITTKDADGEVPWYCRSFSYNAAQNLIDSGDPKNSNYKNWGVSFDTLDSYNFSDEGFPDFTISSRDKPKDKDTLSFGAIPLPAGVIYVDKELNGHYWHDNDPDNKYPEDTFRPCIINTPEYIEKDVEYNRPNGVIDIQYCNGYFYILLNNDHIYKFDANLTLVGIINCNNATAIYVNSNVLFIQDKDGNIFTDRESIKRHPSLYKTNLFYRKKNGEVIELNTKIVAHAQDR